MGKMVRHVCTRELLGIQGLTGVTQAAQKSHIVSTALANPRFPTAHLFVVQILLKFVG